MITAPCHIESRLVRRPKSPVASEERASMAASPQPPMPDRGEIRRDNENTSFGAWTLVSVLYGAKVATIALVVWAEHSYRMALFVTITTWFWLGPLLALGAAPMLFRYRLRRVRARRETLLRQEWETERKITLPMQANEAEPKRR